MNNRLLNKFYYKLNFGILLCRIYILKFLSKTLNFNILPNKEKLYSIFFQIIFTLILLQFASGQSNKFLPKNEIHKDSSLTSFVCKLQYALVKRDKNFILSVVDKNIENGFDGSKGIEEFKRVWDFDSQNSKIWLTISKIISMGGVFTDYNNEKEHKKSFVFPYVYDITLPNDNLDIYEIMAITGENVNLREKPDVSSKIIGKLSYDIVICDYDNSIVNSSTDSNDDINSWGNKQWYKVKTLDNSKQGYIFKDFIWSPNDYRMFLSKINGTWKIVCLITGD